MMGFAQVRGILNSQNCPLHHGCPLSRGYCQSGFDCKIMIVKW